jgi:hypothetical protein
VRFAASVPCPLKFNFESGGAISVKARDRLTFGLRLMFKTSGVFAEIVKESIKREIESSWRDVKKFESVTFAEIVVTAYDRENEIMQSLAKINNFSKFMHGVKLSEGYSVNDLWAEIFAYIRRVNRILRLPRS